MQRAVAGARWAPFVVYTLRMTSQALGWSPRFGAVAVGVVLYAIACATPALTFEKNGRQNWFGIAVLLMGWMGIFFGQIGWFANLLLPIGWVCLLFRRWIAAAIVGVLALVVAANTFFLYVQDVPGDEGGTTTLVFQHPHVGFYFWVASIVELIATAGILYVIDR
jgi:hypothetical protein